MNTEDVLQDVYRCDLCETPVPTMSCDICQKHLCKTCVGEHLSDESKEHKIVSFEKRGSTLQCRKHTPKACELYCRQCKIPICVECVSSMEHRHHDIISILKSIKSKKSTLRRNLQEIEKQIYPKYEEIAKKIAHQKEVLITTSDDLTESILKHGENLRNKIDSAVTTIISHVKDQKSKNLDVLNAQADKIDTTIDEIKQNIDHINVLLDSNKAHLVRAFKSRNAEFNELLLSTCIYPNTSLPTLTFHEATNEQIYRWFGYHLTIFNVTEDKTDSTVAESSLNCLLDEPRCDTFISTGYESVNKLHRVSSVNDEKFWTCGLGNVMKLYGTRGELINSIQTKSGNQPYDITITKTGNLVYADYDDRTVNIVQNTQIKVTVQLIDWKPRSVCSTIVGDLLVVMDSVDHKEAKVVRYTDSKEEESIQYNDKGGALYSSDEFDIKYIVENKNFDICVSDNGARGIVVVDVDGKFRFTYNGHHSSTNKLFDPHGITTDSQNRILVADRINHCIHILDQNGQFLRSIDKCMDKCYLDLPFGLCVDSKGKLYVAECSTSKVKIITYACTT